MDLPSVATAGAAIVLAFCVGFGAVAHVCGGRTGGSLREAICSAAGVVPTPAGAASTATTQSRLRDPTTDPWAHTTHPGMASEGWNWTQLAFSRAGNFPSGGIKRLSAEDVSSRGAMWVWHTTFARSIPAVVEGLGAEYAERVRHWKLADFRREWGPNKVVVAFSDDANFNHGKAHPVYGRTVNHPDRVTLTMAEYLDLLDKPHPGEHIAVQQSPSRDFAEFGLPALPPLLEELVKYTLNARNFWAATPPKVSVLHYDWQDSVLLQVAGTKKFTIIDPARLNTAYPCVAYLQQLKRVAPGEFEYVMTERELDNFPLLNVSHPDLERHPLAKEAHAFEVTVRAGEALLLPAYWYHQVESFAEPGSLNVAVNFWFQGHSLATRLYRTLRENLFINCNHGRGSPHPSAAAAAQPPSASPRRTPPQAWPLAAHAVATRLSPAQAPRGRRLGSPTRAASDTSVRLNSDAC